MNTAASNDHLRGLQPNQSFLRQSGETQLYLQDAKKAQEWRNSLSPPEPKKVKKVKAKSHQITLF